MTILINVMIEIVGQDDDLRHGELNQSENPKDIEEEADPDPDRWEGIGADEGFRWCHHRHPLLRHFFGGHGVDRVGPDCEDG